MNKYISTCLKVLKYIGIALVIGYLFMIVKVLDEQKDEDIPITERIKFNYGRLVDTPLTKFDYFV